MHAILATGEICSDQFHSSPAFIRPTFPAIPVLPWRAGGNGCKYRAGDDAGSASPA